MCIRDRVDIVRGKGVPHFNGTPLAQHLNVGRRLDSPERIESAQPVSYTHLDVYKRQVWEHFAIYRSLPNLQSEKELIRAFEGVERILIELLHSLGGRHSLWVYRYTVPRHEVARFKVVTFHPVDRSVVYVYETYIEQYAVRIAQAWRIFMLDDETDVKLLAILQNGTVLDCPFRLAITP